MRKTALLLTLFLSVSVIYGHAQCKLFTKKRCMESITGYSSNGQYNGAVLFEGEEATMIQTFYSRQDYRIAVCAQSVIGDSVYFEVLDYKDKMLYSSKHAENNVWDFYVESTQQLKVHVVVPGRKNSNSLKQKGCVSILVGFRNAVTSRALINPYMEANSE